jgi:DNA-directed RNA polymerase subunit RPC12/RpoP
MAIVKANYVKRGKGEKGRAKATIRYITHRRNRDGHTVTRELFGFDGSLTKEQTYRMIDEARRGTIFYRIVLSPAPKQEDRYKDLNLHELTLDTMLKLEERLGQPVQFVATIHDDHAPHRHVHTLVLVQGRRLTREDFQALRLEATERALSQRRLRDRVRGYRLQRTRSRINRRSHTARHTGRSRSRRGTPPYQSYTCFLCGYHQALPASPQGYRCPACGLKLRRERSDRFRLPRRKERGWGLELSLSP